MKTFRCVCGERVFFDNTRCLSCNRELGFLFEAERLLALEDTGTGTYGTPYGTCRKCENYTEFGVCNWLLPADSEETACEACRLNRVIPDLSEPANLARWGEVEKAKRRLLFTLRELRLPFHSRAEDPEHGLAFDIKGDSEEGKVLTGHADGLITLNIAEADTVAREQTRIQLNERYRTVLGHFRHEVGHYFWQELVDKGNRHEAFREVFGDERQDYEKSLESHYQSSKGASYSDEFVSAYASSHPWEDWAETFAHYLHMVDTIGTARDYGLAAHQRSPELSLPGTTDFELLLEEWTELTMALNALNRSMGLPDPYPFVLSVPVRGKLEFVHRLVREARAPKPSQGVRGDEIKRSMAAGSAGLTRNASKPAASADLRVSGSE